MRDFTIVDHGRQGFRVKEQPLGTLTVSIFGRELEIVGGPYLGRLPDTIGVKMAKEIVAPCDYDVPTPDFRVPPKDRLYWSIRRSLVESLATGRQIYVGCMAGKGRTGLFLATVAHLTGVDDPVAHVRRHYYPHAVETKEQALFVTGFDRAQFREDLLEDLLARGEIDTRWWWAMTRQDKADLFRVWRRTLPLVGRFFR